MILDKFSRQLTDLRISVTDRCNFRCSYCMPADIFGHDYVFLAKQEILNFEEIHRVARIFAELGVSKIRLTGGEPLLRSDLEVLIKMLSKINGIDDLALTTNGYFLNEKAKNLREAGLKRITVSLDSLDPETLKQLAGDHLNIDRVLSGIESAGEAGFKPIKINAVVRKGMNENEILSLVRFAKTHGHIIRFIEYMDVGTLNGWKMDDVVSAKEVVDMICSEMPIEPIQKNYPSEVANRYRFLNGEGEFGIIASVTQPFCGDCSRARISADGRIYTCLFASEGFDIKTLLRSGVSDEQLKD
ncbi:GTP 3',8-cyclase MoaA, partial [candidate division KSB1 bacterium]|nr:GTP 3',8-cyclase MoaA [candidate division KSB1 bacterium]NIR68646.1 GTP 3',8-cyclase MoaA [candidate division KSB1 bacterium]NIS27135.1 GTP 3',8-cyclase MoaA [candidate division KSB1 bacterium]NIT74021.1 GTP 3',8-cyclase MoaA [candidate division KSB1 bacterium]NIU27887.1 GTP 3',8-cyclase MoaA [candidate division KSB1 bacterium]